MVVVTAAVVAKEEKVLPNEWCLSAFLLSAVRLGIMWREQSFCVKGNQSLGCLCIIPCTERNLRSADSEELKLRNNKRMIDMKNSNGSFIRSFAVFVSMAQMAVLIDLLQVGSI